VTPSSALAYSFLFGLLHGVLPDEHTWPITFSYAIGAGSSRSGMRAGLYFSAAFTLQRMIISEASYLALAPYLLRPSINGIVYFVVGAVMSAAGIVVLRGGSFPHIHLVGHHHDEPAEMESSLGILSRHHDPAAGPASSTPPIRWTLVHGFVAGFGFEGFSLFVNTVAAPAMPNAWLGFIPGLLFGLGTMVMLIVIGAAFGASLRMIRRFTPEQIARIGSRTGARTLLYGGLLFMAAGALTLVAWAHGHPLALGSTLIVLFLVVVAVPSLLLSIHDVQRNAGSAQPSAHSPDHSHS
jgi:sulfite exporter TauE/SafE